ncbi:hypothetical protein ADUPG1_008713, partial [Aduncisulcus paluster]
MSAAHSIDPPMDDPHHIPYANEADSTIGNEGESTFDYSNSDHVINSSVHNPFDPKRVYSSNNSSNNSELFHEEPTTTNSSAINRKYPASEDISFSATPSRSLSSESLEELNNMNNMNEPFEDKSNYSDLTTGLSNSSYSSSSSPPNSDSTLASIRHPFVSSKSDYYYGSDESDPLFSVAVYYIYQVYFFIGGVLVILLFLGFACCDNSCECLDSLTQFIISISPFAAGLLLPQGLLMLVYDEEYSYSHLVTVGLVVGGFFVFVEMIVCKDANLIRDLADFICGSSSMTSLVWIVPVFPIFFMIWLPIVYSDKFISSEYLKFSYTTEEMTTFYSLFSMFLALLFSGGSGMAAALIAFGSSSSPLFIVSILGALIGLIGLIVISIVGAQNKDAYKRKCANTISMNPPIISNPIITPPPPSHPISHVPKPVPSQTMPIQNIAVISTQPITPKRPYVSPSTAKGSLVMTAAERTRKEQFERAQRMKDGKVEQEKRDKEEAERKRREEAKRKQEEERKKKEEAERKKQNDEIRRKDEEIRKRKEEEEAKRQKDEKEKEQKRRDLIKEVKALQQQIEETPSVSDSDGHSHITQPKPSSSSSSSSSSSISHDKHVPKKKSYILLSSEGMESHCII